MDDLRKGLLLDHSDVGRQNRGNPIISRQTGANPIILRKLRANRIICRKLGAEWETNERWTVNRPVFRDRGFSSCPAFVQPNWGMWSHAILHCFLSSFFFFFSFSFFSVDLRLVVLVAQQVMIGLAPVHNLIRSESLIFESERCTYLFSNRQLV